MANIFTRMKEAIAADLHGLLDEKEQKNPMLKLNLYLHQSEQETEKARKLVERHYKLRNELIREYRKATEMANKRLRQSEIAKQANEENLYQFALREYEEYEQRTERLKQLLQETEEQLNNLQEKYEEMQHRLKDMHLKRLELMGRENTVHANYRINKILEETANYSFDRFGELNHYMEELEWKVNNRFEQATFDDRLERLEKEMKNNIEIQ